MAGMKKEIRKAIAKKLGKSERTVQRMVNRLIEESGFTIPDMRIGGNILASNLKVPINQHLSKEELAEVREYRRQLVSKPIVIQARATSKKKERPLIQIGNEIVETFGLPEDISREAVRMSSVYPHFYVFENVLRYIITDTLKKKYGENWWNTQSVVSRPIRERVAGRMKQEERQKWHGAKRGVHEIFYTNLGHLGSIIRNNQEEFKEIFSKKINVILAKLDELENTRNIIAHNNPLPAHEINRIKMYYDDLKRTVSS